MIHHTEIKKILYWGRGGGGLAVEGTEGNGMKKLVLQKILLQQTEYFRPRQLWNGMNGIPREFLLFLFHGTEF
jgi:hypothetical protein